GEQSGFINDMGFETYMKILNEAIEELKEEDWYKEQVGIFEKDDHQKAAFGRSFVKETQIDTDYELLIPDYYIGNITERLNIYRELDNITKELGLIKFEENLKDRFGPLPKQVIELIEAMRMRWLAMEIGFEKLILKNGKLIAYFLSKQDSAYFNSPMFKAVLNYAQKHPAMCKLKEANNKLTFSVERIKSIEEVMGIFNFIRSIAQENAKQEA
ncbi:MAG TPA: TRCF domain-containing protein, partial [Nitrosopumilaceae archaeon]|nr:TRCF domain-containing protein [Nitrosopumilaceae archaeon]